MTAFVGISIGLLLLAFLAANFYGFSSQGSGRTLWATIALGTMIVSFVVLADQVLSTHQTLVQMHKNPISVMSKRTGQPGGSLE